VNARMVFIYSLRRDLELILSAEDVSPLRIVDLRLALLRAFGSSDGFGFPEVGYEFRSRDYRAKVGSGVLDMRAEHL
jgi:hypothetical protein